MLNLSNVSFLIILWLLDTDHDEKKRRTAFVDYLKNIVMRTNFLAFTNETLAPELG